MNKPSEVAIAGPTVNTTRTRTDDSSTLATGAASGVQRGPTVTNRVTLRTLASRYAIIGIWIAMAGVYAGLMPDTFLRMSVLKTIFSSQLPLVFLGLGAMITLVVGEFDMSIASTLGLSATIVPVLVTQEHTNFGVACVVAILAAGTVGLVNGLVVVLAGVSSLIVTLGNATLLLGIASLISHQTMVSGLSTHLADVVLHPILGLPLTFYIGLIVALVLVHIIAFTPLGRHMVFVGSNSDVARLAGVRVDLIRIGAFIAGSTIAGVGGVLLAASVGGFDSTSSPSYLLPTFASVFLGTAVIRPGRFNPIGTLVGVYFMATGILGLELLGHNGWVENVFYGASLIIAVGLATIVRRRTAS
jgi:ribose transport system permease protein